MTETIHNYERYVQSQVKDLKFGTSSDRRSSRPFVTISRETGAYGKTIAKGLAQYLQDQDRRRKCDWTVFHKELLKEVTEKFDLPQTVLPYLSESTISDIQDIIEETCGLHLSRYLLVNKINKTIIHLAQLGYAIIVGRGGNIITSKLPGGVNVRLVGSLEKRVGHIREWLDLGPKEAREYVLREDRNRANYVRKYFEKDINDPLLYDLVINTDTIEPQQVVKVIGNLVLKRM